MNKSSLDIMFFPKIETKNIGKKTIYYHPKITFFIENHDSFDVLGFDNQLFYYKRPQKEIINNNEVFLKIHEDLNVLFEIGLDDYYFYISEIFEGLSKFNKFYITRVSNKFILESYYLDNRKQSSNNNIRIYKHDQFTNPKKMKILESGYIFSDDLFIPISSRLVFDNPFFDTTRHNQIKFFETIEFLTKNNKKFISI